MVKWIIIGVTAFVLVVGAGAGTVWFLLSRNAQKVEVDLTRGVLDPKAKVVDLGKFVTNLADKEGRYIDVNFVVVVKDEKDAKKISDNMAVVRDGILLLLNSLNSKDVIGGEGAENLKRSVHERLNEALGDKLVQRILITSIVVQM
jgi:flagellar basal body-associated protein FliL